MIEHEDIWPGIRHFKSKEFDSPDERGSGKNMKSLPVYICDFAREEYGHPLHINSAYRTPEYNATVKGAVSDSAHTGGFAVDISTPDSVARYCVLHEAMLWGVKRFGIGKNFIHFDTDPEKPAKVVWLYDCPSCGK